MLQSVAPEFGDPTAFDRYRAGVDRETALRVLDGEREARVYYILQSSLFTAADPVEPAVVAGGWLEDQPVPPTVQRRLDEFRSACRKPSTDKRFRYFCSLDGGLEQWRRDFSRAMAFLRTKEHQSREREGDGRREFVASLYRNRGLSTDSGFDANFPVYLALRSLAAKPAPIKMNKVLIVGPGLDYAPRTGLRDAVAPQSIQPYAVMDALLQLGMASPELLAIHCVDVNPRVVAHFSHDRPRPVSLTIFKHDGPDEYLRYFENFERAIGTETSGNLRSRLIHVPAQSASAIRATRLNIVSERLVPVPQYDLVVATNILLYLSDADLSLALANIQFMLRDGGYLVHNEPRAGVELAGAAIGMPVVDARLVRLREDDRRAILDTQVIHRKHAAP